MQKHKKKKIGEYGKKFYMILKGSVLVLVPKKKNN